MNALLWLPVALLAWGGGGWWGLQAAPVEPAPGGVAPFVYRAQERRDPFRAPAAAVTPDGTGTPQEPHQARVKEFLESFQLDSLKLVAILLNTARDEAAGRPGKAVAVIEDPDGLGHLVYEGSYIGVNEGRIRRIRDGEILIEEPSGKTTDPPGSHSMTLRLRKTEEAGQNTGSTPHKNPPAR
ncbi:MAG: pilus assembly protein PilP [Magnetococcus sp. MYC-9]